MADFEDYPLRYDQRVTGTLPVRICNRALTRVGRNPISAIGESDGSQEAMDCDDLYWPVAEECLCAAPHRVAIRQARLNRLPDPPEAKWPAQYQAPTYPRALDYRWVGLSHERETTLAFDIYGDKVYCDAQESDVVVMDYVHRVAEPLWPPWLIRYVTDVMTAELFGTIEASDMQAQWMRISEATLKRAARLSSQARTQVQLPPGRMISVRGAKRNIGPYV